MQLNQDRAFIYIEGSQITMFQNSVFLSLKIDFVLTNSENADEMPHDTAFHLDLHCLPKYPFRGSQSHINLRLPTSSYSHQTNS